MLCKPRIWIAASLWFVTAAAGSADLVPGAAKRLNAYFDSLQTQASVSGSIAISERGVMRYQRSVGFASLENGVAQSADAGTRYRIGSVTRLFTAVMVMQLAEKASLSLDNPLAEFYPDLPNAVGITYRQLLQQRSGLGGYAGAADFDTWRRTPRTHAQMLEVIGTAGAHFKPGERVEYSDSNYLVLGYVLEKIYERSYDDVVSRQVTHGLGLVRTYYAGTGPSSSLESVSYQWTPQGWRAEADSDPSIDGGNGAMVSNAGDLAVFMDALFARKLVTSHSLETMRDQGIGLRAFDIDGNAGLGERGSIQSFNACVYHFPEKRITIAWTSNASQLPMDEIVGEALRLIFDKARKPPK